MKILSNVSDLVRNTNIFIFTPLFTCEYFVFAQIEKSVFHILWEKEVKQPKMFYAEKFVPEILHHVQKTELKLV